MNNPFSHLHVDGARDDMKFKHKKATMSQVAILDADRFVRLSELFSTRHEHKNPAPFRSVGSFLSLTPPGTSGKVRAYLPKSNQPQLNGPMTALRLPQTLECLADACGERRFMAELSPTQSRRRSMPPTRPHRVKVGSTPATQYEGNPTALPKLQRPFLRRRMST